MATNSLGNLVYEIGADISGLNNGIRNAQSALNGLNGGVNANSRAIQNLESRTNSAASSMNSLSRVAASLLAYLSVQQVSSYADAWTVLNNKLSNSVRAHEDLSSVTSRVFDITQSTRSSLDATATVYARLERGTREYNTSAADLVKLTTIINQGFVVSGATASEAENAIIQLSQGIASGVLRGEEFNSVTEQGSRLAVALADSLGVGIGELRKMAGEGKLTTDVVVNGLLSQGNAIGKEFANTTATISQSLQEAGNNITKFFGENSTVKSFVSVFNSSIVSISENIDILSAGLITSAAIMGGRYVGAISTAISAKMADIASTQAQAKATLTAANATANATRIAAVKAKLDKEMALSNLVLAQTEYNVAKGTAAEAFALQNLIAMKTIATQRSAAFAEAQLAQAAATRAATAAAATAAMTIGGLARGALGLIGGPAGAAIIAAGAIYYFYQKAAQAKQESIEFANKLDGLVSSMKSMSQVKLAAEVDNARKSIEAQREEVEKSQASLNSLNSRLDASNAAVKNLSNTYLFYQDALSDNKTLQSESIQLTAKLEDQKDKLSKTINQTGILEAQLNGNLKQGIDLLKRNGTEVNSLSGLMNNLGNAIDFASRAKSEFNSSSLMVERPKKVQEYLDKLQQQVEVESVLDERLRAQLKTEKEIMALGGSDADVRMARERAGAEFDAQKAQEKKRKAESDANSEAKKSANQAESVAIKLEKMKQATELATSSTENLSREQAILRAQQSLGKGATEENIKLAGEYAAAQWDAAKATQALSLIPALGENQQYQADLQALQAALNTKKIDQDTYYAAVEKREQEHQITLAKIRAEQVTSPISEARAEVDPIQALANQNAQKLALMQQYQAKEQSIIKQSYENGKISYQQFIATKSATDEQYLILRNAQETQFNQQMMDAQWQLLSQQGDGYAMLTDAFDAFAGQAGNALTGILTGSMSVDDALRSLGNTILNSVVNSIVQMGVEWVKNLIIQKTLGVAATALGVTQAATLATAWAPAAALASLATLGANAAPATAGITSTVGVSTGLALSGMRKNGGPVNAGSMYQVGENGLPEIFQASNGRQYMIPGDNGSVISNKDLSSGSGGVVVYNNITNNSSASVSSSARDNGDGSVTIETIVSDIEENGAIAQAISRNTTANRRATD